MYINVLNELLHADHMIELTISTKMIVVVNQPSPGNPYREHNITTNGQWQQCVDKLANLEGFLSRVMQTEDEVTVRIPNANRKIGRLRGTV